MTHFVLRGFSTISIGGLTYFSAIGKDFISRVKTNNGFSNYFVTHVIITWIPIAVIYSFTLCPYLFATNVGAVVPANKIQTFAWSGFISKCDTVSVVPQQRFFSCDRNTFIIHIIFYRFTIQCGGFYFYSRCIKEY